MSAIFDVLGPQRSEKGTGLKKVTGAKKSWQRGWGSRGLWELLWLMNKGLRSGMKNQILPTLSQINIQAAIVLIETGIPKSNHADGMGHHSECLTSAWGLAGGPRVTLSSVAVWQEPGLSGQSCCF